MTTYITTEFVKGWTQLDINVVIPKNTILTLIKNEKFCLLFKRKENRSPIYIAKGPWFSIPKELKKIKN